jgi:predicted nucleotidyltransferase
VPEGVIDNRKLTPYRGLDEILIDYAHTSRAVLGDNFVGLYLLGSLAIGDFDLTSDVDFMIVTNSELSRDQVELVQPAHTKLIARDSR